MRIVTYDLLYGEYSHIYYAETIKMAETHLLVVIALMKDISSSHNDLY